MKSAILLLFIFALSSFFSCSTEPPLADTVNDIAVEPEPYLYQPPPKVITGWPSARLKRESLAEAFVSRISLKKPVSIIVMQQEKLVLEEHFGKAADTLVCPKSLYPAYSGAILGSMHARQALVPYPLIPLQDLYLEDAVASSMAPGGGWFAEQQKPEKNMLDHLEKLVQQQTGASLGMAAEELLFEPLRIDDYQWQSNTLCLHPYAMLQLGSLWVRRGRWGDEQVLPDVLVQRVLAPAYASNLSAGSKAYGWQYYRLMAKGRKQPLLFWQSNGNYLFLLPELEAVIFLQGDENLFPDSWQLLQDYLIPSLSN